MPTLCRIGALGNKAVNGSAGETGPISGDAGELSHSLLHYALLLANEPE